MSWNSRTDCTTVTATFYYTMPKDERELAFVGSEFMVVGHTPVMYFSKKQRRTIVDGDYFKKSLTDCITNGLYRLGFGADVRMGQHDDSKYIDEVVADVQLQRDEAAAKRAVGV